MRIVRFVKCLIALNVFCRAMATALRSQRRRHRSESPVSHCSTALDRPNIDRYRSEFDVLSDTSNIVRWHISTPQNISCQELNRELRFGALQPAGLFLSALNLRFSASLQSELKSQRKLNLA